MSKPIPIQDGNEILNNIFYLLNTKGVRQKDLADYLGISRNSITQWKTKKTSSYLKYIDKIASYFNVTSQELLNPIKENMYESLLSPEEIQIIQQYRSLNNERIKKSFELLLNELANSHDFGSQGSSV